LPSLLFNITPEDDSQSLAILSEVSKGPYYVTTVFVSQGTGTGEPVFDQISKHLEVCQKYPAARPTFIFALSVCEVWSSTVFRV